MLNPTLGPDFKQWGASGLAVLPMLRLNDRASHSALSDLVTLCDDDGDNRGRLLANLAAFSSDALIWLKAFHLKDKILRRMLQRPCSQLLRFWGYSYVYETSIRKESSSQRSLSERQ